MTEVRDVPDVVDVAAPRLVGPRRRAMRVFAENKMAVGGLAILAIMLASALLGPLLSPYDTTSQDLLNRLQAPSWAHPMGTDELGRDSLTRIFAGGRVSLAVAALATLASLAIGVIVGSLAGFFGGWVDNVLMRLVDLFLSLPDLFLLIFASALLGPSFRTMVVIIALVRWMNMARLVRASFLSLREREFVEAARAMGTRRRWIVLRHLLPNSMGPIVVAATLTVASAIIAESTLSFLGLGIQPPAASWGSMLRNAESQIYVAPWMGIFPGVMIFLTVIAINFVGDGLRDVLDPGAARTARGSSRRRRAMLEAAG